VQGELEASNADFYRVVRRGEYLSPDDFLPLLEEFLAAAKGSAHGGQAVIMSGVLPNPKEILTLLDELGVRIAHDDLLNCSRRLLVPPSRTGDPFDALTESYFAMPPCTTKDSSVSERVDGLVVHSARSCTPYSVGQYDIKRLLMDRLGVPSVVIEADIADSRVFSEEQTRTRLEAFFEAMEV